MPETRVICLLLLILLLPHQGFATTVYKSVDAEGRVSFSDTPPADSTKSELLEYTDYPTGMSALDLARLQAMRETADRMRNDRLARERERATREAELAPPWPTDYTPPGAGTGDGYYYPIYAPRRPYWRQQQVPRPPMIRNPRAASPEGLVERIRRSY